MVDSVRAICVSSDSVASPARSACPVFCRSCKLKKVNGRLAQPPERLPYKQEVTGSIPVPPTIISRLQSPSQKTHQNPISIRFIKIAQPVLCQEGKLRQAC